ncbi:4-nitrophenylphosphatase [Catenaria anguillulae PL171]|uniref:4-nitrophenylphosphatase n=1 Tax=Catenaria anguillulae PL171 TaxID=765915 RepID=A0A1Y2HWJ5_9FUNG|nr:4-nitrophenylphosphatase [Catenaria anguillulae PL171]
MKHLNTPEEIATFISSMDTFLLDVDGVVFLGTQLIPGVVEALAHLRSLGKRIFFVTNNSLKSRTSYVEKFSAKGIHGVAKEEVFSAPYAAACYLSDIGFPKEKRVYVMGADGVVEELREQGIQACGGMDDKDLAFSGMDDLHRIQPDPSIGAVLTAFDAHINYPKLAKAHTYLQDPSVLFIATNPDVADPIGTQTFPAAGSMYQPLIKSTGRHPIIVGKPHETMLRVILAKYQLDPTRTCMVGDRLDTDVLFGQRGGCRTMAVLTGVTTESMLNQAEVAKRPDYVISSLGLMR